MGSTRVARRHDRLEPGGLPGATVAGRIDAREERNRQTFTKPASPRDIKTLEQYDFGFASSAPPTQIQELASLMFVERAENLVLLGLPGVGKTDIGSAQLYRATQACI
ncbi:ATP-binding protein [Ralstonia solanacearum]|uniref:ATP-binding protein n=1 Tax=Ralstonia solanacearum TaxID=305 RepID=UPI00399D704B